MLKILLPTTFPTAKSVAPDKAAFAETATSGALVPNATIVKPTISGGMPKNDAIWVEPRINRFAPTIRSIKPATK